MKKGEKIPYSLGHFFIAINIESFIDIKTFKKITGNILRDLRNSKKAPGHNRNHTAGEKEYEAWKERKNKVIPLGKALRQQFIQMREELKLNVKFE